MPLVKYIISITIFFFFISFSQEIKIDSSLTGSDKEYINPSYSFPAPHIKEKDHGYPYSSRVYPSPDRGINQLPKFIKFCDHIKKHFIESNMTIEEADEFYALLERHLKISDGYYGMPSPSLPKPKPVKLKDRVMIKKLNDTQYTIFYYEVGCGCSYIYSEVVKDSEDKLKIEKIEVWKEHNPC